MVKKKPKAELPANGGEKGKLGPTKAEQTASDTVGKAGMTALGKRLVDDDGEVGDKRARVDS